MKVKDLITQIKSISFEEALEYLAEKAAKKGSKTFVVTINPEIVMLARRDRDYFSVLQSTDLALNDGVGITLAGKIMGKSFKGRIHGSDLVEKLSEKVSKQPITVGFLGGKQNVAELTAKRLVTKYPGLKVSFALEEWPAGFPKLASDILFVAFGSPKQEKWIYDNLPKINVNVAIGVGGSFDYLSGRVMRAPKLIRNLGLEWLFRLIRQPWRIKRQSSLIYFVLVVVKEKLFFS